MNPQLLMQLLSQLGGGQQQGYTPNFGGGNSAMQSNLLQPQQQTNWMQPQADSSLSQSNQAAATPNLNVGWQQYQQQRGYGQQVPQMSGGLFPMPYQHGGQQGYGGGMMDRMRQMQGGYGQGYGGYGQQGGYGGGYGQQQGGGYGGGWNDIVGNHMMQRQQMMNQPNGASGAQRPQSPYPQRYPRQGWSSGFGGQPGVTPPGSVA